MKLEKILLIPDCHHPYHDKRAWNLMLKAAAGFKPDTIVILGDFADFYAVSAHSKDPARVNKLEYEVTATKAALTELDALKARRKVFVAGNHENRLERYLADKAPELFGLVGIPDLLDLPKRGWEYVPYKTDIKIGHLYCTHDVGASGRGAVFANLAAYQGNVVGGHTHRLQYIVEGNAKGKAHVSATFGWLGDAKQADYMHRIKAARDWAMGFGIGYKKPNGTVHLTPVPLIEYTCVVEGKHYAG